MSRLRSLFLALVLVSCLLCAGCAGRKTSGSAVSCEYEQKLFSSGRVHTVDVTLAEADWADLLSHPLEKTKYAADVAVDGEVFRNVAFSTKGNSSLAAVASVRKSCRYSYKINFGKFDREQAYHGLNKLHLNNLYGDATHMKDYVSYELFRRAGVSAPLISYAWLSVNGEPVGLYIAVEDMSESFLDRTLDGSGTLYKPECDVTNVTGRAGGQAAGGPLSVASSFRGADLRYIDDDPGSYPDIFGHTQTETDDAGRQRVVDALRGFGERKDPETFLDTREIVRYFAAHNFVLNGDSYTGMIPTNYCLYERNGKLAMLPWDYNLAFGAFPVGMPGPPEGVSEGTTGSPPSPVSVDPSAPFPAEGISVMLNTGVDSPLTNLQDWDRPMWGWILSGDYFLDRYHDALRSLVSGFFDSGDFDALVDSLYSLLLPYAEKDPTAFYTAEEFTRSVEVFRQFCRIRAESVRAQLDGKLSRFTAGQDAAARIDASGIDMEALGTPLHDFPVSP